MRSELVTQAAVEMGNRYLLMHVASAITKKFHRRGKARIQESINDTLRGLGQGKYFVCPDRTISGIVTPEQTAVAIATGQLKPYDAMVLTGFATFATKLPCFPAEPAPAPAEQDAESA